jgi:sugar O-acyltransferase (sialic acid O-acetyltransferase NeuD family)
MANVVLFGHAEMARMTCFYLRHDSPHEVVAFTVDRARISEETLLGLPIVPFEDVQALYPPQDYRMAVPIAFSSVNRVRASKYGEAKAKGYELISYVSSRASTWPDLATGDNCFIFEGSVVGPYVRIGDDVVIAGASVGHDSVIADHCFLAAHAVVLGSGQVGAYSVLGANSTCRDGITIGSGCIIGAGVTMTKSAADRGVYVATPVERLDKSSDVLSQWVNWPVR